jgi:hypothetical protein
VQTSPLTRPTTVNVGQTTSPLTRPTTQAAPARTTATDRALTNKVALNGGTTFRTKNEAVQSFRNQYASKYTTTFTTRPSVRPSYIPDYYTISGGPRVHVIYDYGHHGYGYYYGGRWTTYDPFMDALVLSTLMNQNNYYVDPNYGYVDPAAVQPVQTVQTVPVAVQTTSTGSTTNVLLVILIIAVGITIIVLVAKRSL